MGPHTVRCMRILHTSDWHLGRTLHGVDLTEAHAAFFSHLVDVVQEERVDAVLVAGDVYDRALPPLAAVELLSETLCQLSEHTRVVVTPGNHDSAARLGFVSKRLDERLSIRCRFDRISEPVIIPSRDGGQELLVYAVPWLEPDRARYAMSEEVDPDGGTVPLPRSHEALTAAAMKRIEADLTRRRATTRVSAMVMAHGFVAGGAASDSEVDIKVGGIDCVPHAVFGTEVDYVALGHLHGAQRVGPTASEGPTLRYSGSPLAFSFSERNHRKATTLVETGADGRVASYRQIEAPVPRQLSEVRGTLEEVLGRKYDGVRDHWVRVVVEGETRPDELHVAVRRAFPHLLEGPFFVPTGEQRALVGTSLASVVDPMDVLEEFVCQVSNHGPDAFEREILRDALESARRASRTA